MRAKAMRFSFTTFSTPRSKLVAILSTARDLGYDGIEPRLDARHGHGIELGMSSAQRKSARRMVEESGVALACIATPCGFSNPRKSANQLEACRRHIDLAGDLGCHRIRVFGGKVPDGLVRDQSQGCLIDSLRAIAPYAAERQVALCVETHDAWCDTAILAFIMREVDHPAVGITWDVIHTQRGGQATPEEAFRALRPWIKHVHIHDGLNRTDVLRLVPMGTGDFDPGTVLRLLRHDEYDGFISGEWMESTMEAEFFVNHLRLELTALKRLLAR